jgi:hypothetical protein
VMPVDEERPPLRLDDGTSRDRPYDAE